MNRAVQCALHGSFVYTVLMNNKVWHSVGLFDAYQYIADALWLHDTWQVLYMTADLKVIRCDEGYFNILVGQSDAALYITNSIRQMSQEIGASYGRDTWQDIENAMQPPMETVTVDGEEFGLCIVKIHSMPYTFAGVATDKRDLSVATAVSGSAKQVRAHLMRKLRYHVKMAAY